MSKLEQQRQKVETEEAKESDLDHSSAIVAQETVQAGELDQTDKIN